jgi:hypothetical protein
MKSKGARAVTTRRFTFVSAIALGRSLHWRTHAAMNTRLTVHTDKKWRVMLKSYVEAVCWLTRHEGAVLVVTPHMARVVDVHHHADGVNNNAARALQQPQRILWFEVETDARAGERKLFRLNERGAAYHQRLVARRKCACHARAH